MTEPVLDYGDSSTDTPWYEWLGSKDDAQLTAYWEFIREWSPAQALVPEDPDAMQLKYEMAAQLMSQRGL